MSQDFSEQADEAEWSRQARPPEAESDHEDGASGGTDGTGHPEVDEVLASLDGLEERPVGEHVAVFESAHDRLRGALADAGNDQPGS